MIKRGFKIFTFIILLFSLFLPFSTKVNAISSPNGISFKVKSVANIVSYRYITIEVVDTTNAYYYFGGTKDCVLIVKTSDNVFTKKIPTKVIPYGTTTYKFFMYASGEIESITFSNIVVLNRTLDGFESEYIANVYLNNYDSINLNLPFIFIVLILLVIQLIRYGRRGIKNTIFNFIGNVLLIFSLLLLLSAFNSLEYTKATAEVLTKYHRNEFFLTCGISGFVFVISLIIIIITQLSEKPTPLGVGCKR